MVMAKYTLRRSVLPTQIVENTCFESKKKILGDEKNCKTGFFVENLGF